MGKFNREFGKDLKAFAASTEATGGESVKVGAGLLNDASKGNKMKIIYVQREEIDKNSLKINTICTRFYCILTNSSI